jgi:hypothetical protein
MKLKDIIKLMSVIHGRKIPCDIPEILDEEYYSKSKDTNIKYGELDIIHFLRVVNNNNSNELYDELVKSKQKIIKLEKKLDKVRNIL